MCFFGKLDGPKLRRETIMDCFLLPFIFSIRAAISILLLLQLIILPAMMLFPASLIKQAIQWLLFVVILFLTTKFGRALWLILSTDLCIVFIVPIVFYTFYKSIYDFGPAHRKRSFIDILSQPVPGIDFEEQHDDSNSHLRHRFNHKMISHRLLRNKTLSSEVSRACRQSRNSLQTHQEVCHVHAQRATHRHHSHTPKIISSIPSRRTTHDQLF